MKLFPLKAKLWPFNILKMGKLRLPGRDGSYQTHTDLRTYSLHAHTPLVHTRKHTSRRMLTHTYTHVQTRRISSFFHISLHSSVLYVYVHIFCKNDKIYCWKFNCVTTWVTQHARTTERTTCKVMLALRSDGGRRHEQVDRCWFDLVPIIHRCLAPSILQTNRSEIYF